MRYLMLLFSFLALSVFGQNVYSEFLEEGKIWHYTSRNYFTGNCFDFDLFVCGDTIIQDIAYKKIFQDDLNNYQYALYEKDSAVYIFDQSCNNNPRLLYDFNKNVGENISYDYYIEDIDTIEVDSRLFRRFHIESVGDIIESFFWIEGIGSQFNLEIPLPYTGNTVRFVSCEVNGNTLFTDNDFYKPSITNITNTTIKRETGKTFNLAGMEVSTNYKGLVIKDGKTMKTR